MRNKEGPPESGKVEIATVARTVHWTHGNRPGTRSGPCQSERAISEMPAPHRQAWRTTTSGTGPVPRQVPSAPFGCHQAIKGLNAV